MSMGYETGKPPGISEEFRARLGDLRPGRTVRALVMLGGTAERNASRSRRLSPVERQAAVEKHRDAANRSLKDLDAVLAQFGGKRLSAQADALGCVLVETTAAGVHALAASKRVKAVLEDQPVSLPGAR